jgi:tetratricopeptide (TPR) repeat protein
MVSGDEILAAEHDAVRRPSADGDRAWRDEVVHDFGGASDGDESKWTDNPSFDALQVTSPLDHGLFTPTFDEKTRRRLYADLVEAREAYLADPSSEEKIIWYGRRMGYLGRYQGAVFAYSSGMVYNPGSYKIRRHRGHRYITLRRFRDAIQDLTRAAALSEGHADEIEPDGAPNAMNIPRGTIKFNIWYHLGLAYYLTGDFDAASRTYEECLAFCDNDDSRVATLHWYYMTLRRLDRDAEAETLLEFVTADMDIIENFAYHELLLMYKGLRSPCELLTPGDDPDAVALNAATVAYGVGNWHLYNERPNEAREIFEGMMDGETWAAFGFIAAETDLRSLRINIPAEGPDDPEIDTWDMNATDPESSTE